MFKLSEVPNKKIKCLFPQKEKSKTTTKGDSVPKDHALQSGKTILVLREPPTPHPQKHFTHSLQKSSNYFQFTFGTRNLNPFSYLFRF